MRVSIDLLSGMAVSRHLFRGGRTFYFGKHDDYVERAKIVAQAWTTFLLQDLKRAKALLLGR